MRVVIVDLKIGNIQSLKSAINFLGVDSEISKENIDLENASHLIISGVGAFDSIMQKIEDLNIKNLLINIVLKKKKPILGICVGMQVFFNKSEEGKKAGLGFFDDAIFKLQGNKNKKEFNNFKVPNVGFHKIFNFRKQGIFQDLKNPFFYFTHSFAAESIKDKKTNYALCEHNNIFVAAVQKENICGVQFHPEKSQSNGLKILKNFIENKK